MSEFLCQKPLILASGSPNRRMLLESLGLCFEIHPPLCDEDALKGTFSGKNDKLAAFLAREKAREVSERFPEAFVLAADQVCLYQDTVFNKPLTFENARLQLERLSGNTHQLMNAVCLMHEGKPVWEHEETAVLSMRALTSDAINAYLQADTPLQSCGSYHFESCGKWLFTHIEGHESTITGLPLLALANALLQHGVVSLPCGERL